MAIDYPNQVEAVLLYDQVSRPLRLDAVLQHLNAGLRPFGIVFKQGMAFGDDGSSVFTCGDIFVLVSHNPRPLALDGFKSALSSSFLQSTFPDAREKVEKHRSNVFITVSLGLPLTPELIAANPVLAAMPRTIQDRQIFLNLVRFLMGMVEAVTVVRGELPSCMHWMQSDKLVAGDLAYQLCSTYDVLSLLYRKDFYRTVDEAGREAFGIETRGARHLLGSELRFEPVPVTPVALLKWTHSFIFMSFEKLIPDGDTFGTESDLRIRVLHGPDKSLPGGGLIRLVLEYSEEYFFDRTKTSSAGMRVAGHEGKRAPAPWTSADESSQQAASNLVRGMRSRFQTPPAEAKKGARQGMLRALFRRLH